MAWYVRCMHRRSGQDSRGRDRFREYSPSPPTTAELLKAVFDDTHQLAVLEVALAKEELGRTAKSVIGGRDRGPAAAAALSVIALPMLVVAVLLAVGVSPALSLFVGAAVLLSVAGIGLFVGYRIIPKDALGNTRTRLRGDLRALRDRAA